MWMSKGARWSAIMLGLQVASCMSIELSVRSAGHMQQQPMRLKGGSSYFSKEGGGSGVTRNATKPSAPAGWTSGKGQAPQPKGQGGGTKAAQADVASKAGQKQEEEAAAPPPPAMKPVIPRMSQTVTRMESYSMLDEDKITSKLRDEAEVAPSAHPIPLPTGKTKAQPKPEPPKEVTDAWLRVLDQAVGGKTVLKAERPEEVIQEVSRISAAAKAEQVAAKAAETAEVAEEQEQPEEDGRLRIVIISSELTPYSKSGGLADVASKLSISLSQMGHRVMTVAPAYKWYEGAVGTDVRRTFTLYGGGHDVHYLHQWCPTDPREDGDPKMGVDRIFVQNANAFERAGMYGDPGGHDYFDNLFRFALFSWAALEAPLILPSIAPFGEKVIFIANDWQCGLVPLILTSHYRRWRVYGPARCLFVIHNMGYHGNFPNPQMYNYDLPDPRETPKWSFCDIGLADNSYYDNYKWVFPPQERGDGGVVDDGECAKLLLGGINMADRVVTVSPSYKEEIMTDGGGWGLQHNVRARSDRLDGILNGIDTEEWDPETSKALPAQFSKSDLSGKAICKEKLQEALGLQKNPNAPIIAFIGRLAPQKGIDVLQECFHWLMGGDDQGVLGDAQLIMMGNGQAEYANFMRAAEGQYKGRICGYVGFSSEMEQRIIAGADILIMPSRYEPCGLPQMYAQRYGTIPVVHATGGLKDSVQQFEWREGGETVGTGWKFGNCDANGLKWGLWNALEIYKKKPEVWDNLRKRCMEQDFSWIASAKKYIQLMEWATMDPPKHEPWPFR